MSAASRLWDMGVHVADNMSPEETLRGIVEAEVAKWYGRARIYLCPFPDRRGQYVCQLSMTVAYGSTPADAYRAFINLFIPEDAR